MLSSFFESASLLAITLRIWRPRNLVAEEWEGSRALRGGSTAPRGSDRERLRKLWVSEALFPFQASGKGCSAKWRRAPG